ncbi:response regulator [Reyranella sp.]|uniref:response regulator n=1 Tax=Reyranella sp. TaxID=1929291 RepID=UPI003D0F54C0
MKELDRAGLFELFVDGLPDYALCLLDIDGTILSWNAGASRLMGYASQEVVGRNVSLLYAAEEAATKPAMGREEAAAHGRYEHTGRRVRRDGTEIEAQTVLIPLHAVDKTLMGYGMLIREPTGLPRTAPTLAASGKLITLPRPKRILVVDDNAQILETIDAQLTSLGYRVIAAADAAAALDILTGPGDIDLLLTDVVMPGGMNGSQLAVEARRLRPGIKVLFTSGYFEVALVRDGKLDEGTQVLAKPYRKHQLAQSVSEALSNESDPAR